MTLFNFAIYYCNAVDIEKSEAQTSQTLAVVICLKAPFNLASTVGGGSQNMYNNASHFHLKQKEKKCSMEKLEELTYMLFLELINDSRKCKNAQTSVTALWG